MKKFPSSKEILQAAVKKKPNASINELHSITFEIMKHYRDLYYPLKVDNLLSRKTFSGLSNDLKKKIKQELLKPIKTSDKVYVNFMEESARRMSQTFQPISGNLAELCVEKFLIDCGLIKNKHYTRKQKRTDFIFYYPVLQNCLKKHRVEVKNVKLRERGIRGLSFDGDSLLGFFNQASEFSQNTIKLIDDYCKTKKGYCYVPPSILKSLSAKIKRKRFKSNEDFADDMKRFVSKGFI